MTSTKGARGSSALVHLDADGHRREYDFLFWEAVTAVGVLREFAIRRDHAICFARDELARGGLQDLLMALVVW